MRRTDSAYSIAFVCDCQLGLISRILDLYRSFRKPPSIVVLRKGNRIQFDPRLSVRLERIPLPVTNVEKLNLITAFPAFFGYLCFSVIHYLMISRLKAPIRLVHCHFVFPQGLYGLILARLLRAPLVITAAGSDVNVMMDRNPLLRSACVLIMRRAEMIIAVSKPLLEKLHRYHVRNCVHLPNSVDVSSIRHVGRGAKTDSILFVGMFTENKRPLVLVRALKLLTKQIPSAKLIMCGDGPLMPLIRDEIAKLGLQDNVKLMSNVSPQRLDDIRSSTPVFVLPSAAEGLSRALLEAMAAGQAIVASNNESNQSVIDNGKNGLLFEIDNPEDLADKIRLVVTDDQLRSRLSAAATQVCRTDYSNQVVAKKLENYYYKFFQQHK